MPLPPSQAWRQGSTATGAAFSTPSSFFVSMLRGLVRRQSSAFLQHQQRRWGRMGPLSRGHRAVAAAAKGEVKSEWWVVDGEMHEIGDHVPHRERFIIPRDNLPNKRRKQLRELFMRRTRLVLKDSVRAPPSIPYPELSQELKRRFLICSHLYSLKSGRNKILLWDLCYSKYRR